MADIDAQTQHSLIYNKLLGNSYAAALFIGFTSLIENHPSDLAGQKIGFFSYGSGCVAEFFSGTIVQGYQEHLFSDEHRVMLEKRNELTYDEYLALYTVPDPQEGESVVFAPDTTGRFRLAKISDHKREYVQS